MTDAVEKGQQNTDKPYDLVPILKDKSFNHKAL